MGQLAYGFRFDVSNRTLGLSVVTAADQQPWQAWKRTSKLEAQRSRRREYRRIDYYPNDTAQAIIDARTGNFAGGNYSSVIDALILAAAGELPEYSAAKCDWRKG